MKVCLLTPELGPAWGGIGTYAYNLARGLRDRAEVHVLTGTPEKAGLDDALDGVQVHRAFPDGNAGLNGSPFRFQAAVFRRLPRLARLHGFDVVHANHAYMSDLLVRLRRRRGATVVTVHTTLDTQVGGTLLAGRNSPRQSFEARLARWRFLLQPVERHYLRGSPAMIFVSRWVQDRTMRFYGVSPPLNAIVPNAIDTGRLSPATPEGSNGTEPGEPPTLLFAGRLLALKGIDTLIHAMARVTPRVRLLLAGPGEQGPWKALANDLGVGDRCTFVGRVPYAEMPGLYRAVDAVILPSFAESCPLVALEAMACGTPLVAADAGGVSEIVRDGETGWVFPPGDVDALASRIETVLSDPERARQVSRRARAWIEANATIDQMAARTFRVYERLLGAAA